MRFLLWLVLMLAAAQSGWRLGWTPPANKHPATVQTVPRQISILVERRPSLARLRQRFQQDQLAPDTLPRRVLAAIERSKTDGSFEVQALLTQWFQEDREGLRKWLLAERPPRAIFRSVARLWVREDLEKAWLEKDHQGWHSALYEAIVHVNPQALFTGPHPPRHITQPSPNHIRDAAMRWAEMDFKAASEAVQKGNAEGAVGLAQVKYRQASFSDALRWADSFEPHRETALCAVIDQLAKEDLEKAIRHLSEYGVTDTSYLAISNVQRALADRSAEDVVDLLRRYPVSIPRLYTTLNDLPADPRELEKMLAPIADQLVEASSQALSIWTPSVEEVDIIGTLDRLANDPGNALQQSILRRSLETWRGNHTQLVLDWIGSREDAVERTRYAFFATRLAALHVYGMGDMSMPFELLNLVQPDLLSEIDAQGKLKIAQQISTSMQAIAKMDPHRAIAQAERLEISEWRNSAMNRIAATWSQYDEAATVEWLLSLTAEEREAAAKRLPDHIEEQLAP